MKYEGELKGMPVYSDPNCPPGMLYFINEDNLGYYSIDARSKWRRALDWIKKLWSH